MFQIKKHSSGHKSSAEPKSSPQSPQTDGDNPNMSISDDLPTPSPAKQELKHTKPSRSNKKKEKTVSQEAEKDFMENVSTTVKTLGELVTSQKSQASTSRAQTLSEADDHDIWASLLAKKVRRMDPMDGDEFKLKVDTLALTYLQK